MSRLPTVQRGVVRPLACLSEGWQLIRHRYWLYLGICFVGVLLAGALPMAILVGPMMCGIHYCLLREERGKTVKFDMLFKGFEDFLPSFIATLIMMVPMLLIAVPAYAIVVMTFFSKLGANKNGPLPPGAGEEILIIMLVVMFAAFVATTLVSALFMFVYPLIAERKLSGWDAVKASFAGVLGNLGGILGLSLLQMLLTSLGVLCCYVGVFFVMPLHFASIAVAYRKVFPDKLEEEHQDPTAADYADE